MYSYGSKFITIPVFHSSVAVTVTRELNHDMYDYKFKLRSLFSSSPIYDLIFVVCIAGGCFVPVSSQGLSFSGFSNVFAILGPVHPRLFVAL